MFNLIDKDKSGEIDFNEYIQVLTTYCLFTKNEVLQFVFEVYDEDSSGALDKDEFDKMCKITLEHSDLNFTKNINQALEKVNLANDGLIGFNEFKEIHKKFPMLTYTAFHVQDMLQKHTLGKDSWRNIILHQKRAESMKENPEAPSPPLPNLSLRLKFLTLLYGEKPRNPKF